MRERYLDRWEARAAQLQPAEEELHAKCHPDVQAVIAGKRLLLFAEMLKEFEVSHTEV